MFSCTSLCYPENPKDAFFLCCPAYRGVILIRENDLEPGKVLNTYPRFLALGVMMSSHTPIEVPGCADSKINTPTRTLICPSSTISASTFNLVIQLMSYTFPYRAPTYFCICDLSLLQYIRTTIIPWYLDALSVFLASHRLIAILEDISFEETGVSISSANFHANLFFRNFFLTNSLPGKVYLISPSCLLLADSIGDSLYTVLRGRNRWIAF